MSANTVGRPVESVLAQAGIAENRFRGKHFQFCEMTSARLTTLQSLEPAGQLRQSLATCGIELPEKVNQSSGGDPSVLCLRPGQWLIIEEAGASAMRRCILDSVDPGRTLVLDRSDGLAMFRLTGTAIPWLLSKVCGLDFLAGTGSGRHCASTRLARTAVTIHYHGAEAENLCFDLLFERSIAAHVWALLKASAEHADELAERFGGGRW